MNKRAIHILNKTRNNAVEINLSKLNLEVLSDELSNYKKVRMVNLQNNRLSKLPDSINTNRSLEILNLSNNLFKVFPDNLSELKIKTLNIGNNKLSDLSGLVSLSNSLEKLNLSGNRLIQLRIDFGNFKKLKGINLSDNSITKFPRSLKNENLTSLNLASNSITFIPDSFENIGNLVELDLSYNKIQKLPESIGELKNLKILKITGNQITELPKCLGKLKKLHTLELSGNPIGLPPVEVAKQGVKGIVNYYLHLGEFVRLNEAKLLIVGQGNVGKTFLISKLVFDDLPEDKTTRGIEITSWMIKQQTGSPVRVNAWDFGGQEIYHSTHQFFLTQRSIYLFVWEARKDENILHFDYWLNIIKTLSNSSPVLVVMNKVDERSIEIDEKTMREIFPNVAGFHKTSAIDGTGLKQLSQNIKEEILGLSHIGDKLPKVWSDIRQELEQLETNYISYDKYNKVCAEHGLNNESAKTLSKYLHDLGVFLHFSDNKTLKTKLFLNPKWVTDSVYSILDFVEVAQNGGVFDVGLVESKLPSLSHDEVTYIIAMMEKFELCFEISNDKFIIPELLSPTEPEKSPVDFSKSISLSYVYDFMPAGIVTRATVRMKQTIFQNTFWKNGAYFRHKDAHAKIESKDLKRTINIEVTGKDDALLLEIIKKEIDQINNSLNNPAHKIHIQCNCSVCKGSDSPHMFAYDYLERAIEKIRYIPCQKSIIEVDIQKLMKPYRINHPTGQNDILHTTDSLLFHLVQIATRLCERKYTVQLEDLITDNFVDQLRNFGYRVSDQTRSGRSGSGKTSGELDFMIRDSHGLPVSIVEAMRIDSFGMANTTVLEHLTKLLVDYDTTGLPVNFMMVYSESDNFDESWKKYNKYIGQLHRHHKYDPKVFEIFDFGLKKELSRRNGIQVMYSNHSKTGEKERRVYHIFIDMKQSKQ